MSPREPIQRAARIKPEADVVFCIDVTGSMAPCIEAVRQHVNVFVDALDSVDYRLRLIAYRDLHDPTEKGPEWFRGEFTNSAAQFRQHLADQEATGGGERRTGESTLDALFEAVHSSWRGHQCHKTIILFTDDASHPTLHPTTYSGPNNTEFAVIKDFQILTHTLLYMVAPQCEVYQKIVDLMKYVRGDRKVFLHSILPSNHPNFDCLSGVEWSELLASLGRRVSESSAAAALDETMPNSR
jgi:hypothetical protein